jgi:hypothetical protein
MCARASSVSLVFCAPSTPAATSSLKAWTRALGLPRGKLHGVIADGLNATLGAPPAPPSPYANTPPPPAEPSTPPKAAEEAACPLIIKYGSAAGGDAHGCAYGGDYRGVLLTPVLADAAVRQYGYLPLRLFDDEGDGDDDEGGDAGLGATVRAVRTASPQTQRAAGKARSGSAGPGARRPPLGASPSAKGRKANK